VFENIKLLRPYFHSLREWKDNVSLDVKLPLNWIIDDILKSYSSVQTKIQDKNDTFSLLSIISNSNKEGYDIVFDVACNIIKKNIELEEKEKLFQQKIKELEVLFRRESLDKLKELTIINNEQENTTSEGVVGEGDREGQNNDSESQESDD
jgi:hypothetical protein